MLLLWGWTNYGCFGEKSPIAFYYSAFSGLHFRLLKEKCHQDFCLLFATKIFLTVNDGHVPLSSSGWCLLCVLEVSVIGQL